MYICLCNALKEKDFKKAGKCRAECAEQLFAELGCQPVCGGCVEYVEDFILPQTHQAASTASQ